MVQNSGIAQESVLGPVLFLIYINDLEKMVDGNLRLFADDTVLLLAGKNKDDIEAKASDFMDRIQSWLHHNKMALNVEKTNYIVFKNFQFLEV